MYSHTLSLIKKYLRSHTVTVLENDLPPTTKRFKGLKDCIQTTYGKKFSSEREGVQIMIWWYSWVVSFCQFPYLAFITKFEPLCVLKKIVFQYCVCVRSFEHFCDGRNMVSQYSDSGRSFPKDSIFACKTKSVWRTRARTNIYSNGIHCSG